MTDEEVKEWSNLVGHVANQLARQYRMLDRQDIVQEIWMWFITHEKKMDEWAELPRKDQTALVNRSIRNAGIKFCESEKAKVVGYELNDVHYYDKNTVELFLPYVLSDDYEVPSELRVEKSARSTKDPSEGNGWLAIRSDIRAGFNALSESHQAILRLRFLNESRTYAELGRLIESSEGATRKKVERAIAALINKIGGKRVW